MGRAGFGSFQVVLAGFRSFHFLVITCFQDVCAEFQKCQADIKKLCNKSTDLSNERTNMVLNRFIINTECHFHLDKFDKVKCRRNDACLTS